MQNSEENRILKLQGYFKAFTESQRAIIPIIHRCLEGMDAAADTCDPKKVSSKAAFDDRDSSSKIFE